MPERVINVIAAPNSFRGSLGAIQASASIAEGVRHAYPGAHVVERPVADGGESTADILLASLGGIKQQVEVLDALGRAVKASYVILDSGRTAVVEVSQASGASVVPQRLLNPLRATSYGTGQLIRHALDRGCSRIIVGLGDSATVDGGVGLLQGLGARFLGPGDEEIGLGGEALACLREIDLSRMDPRLRSRQITVACDIDVPLSGPGGAALLLGPQKGATLEMARTIDANLRHLGDVLYQALGADTSQLKYAGASGGIAASLHAVAHGQLVSGIDLVMELTHTFDDLRSADLVITGEGKLDHLTLLGKGPLGVALAAKRLGIPVIAVVGIISNDYSPVRYPMFDAVVPIADRPMSIQTSRRNAARLISAAIRRALLLVTVGARVPAVPHQMSPNRY